MELYLIRHGIAAEREQYTRDQDRPLTEKGYQRTQKVAKRLRDIGVRFKIILTSPLMRAQQTAQILREMGLTAQVQEVPFLAPNGSIQEWVHWLQQWENEENMPLALVGHQPDLSHWAEQLIWGGIQEKLILKKAGIIGVNIPKTVSPIRHSNLFLLTSPKWFI